MIGLWGILLVVAELAVGLLFAIAALRRLRYEWAAMRTPALRSRPRVYFEVGGVVLSLVVCLILIVVAWKEAGHVAYLRQLHTLDQASVVSIVVGSKSVSSPADRERIVGALRASQWYEVSHAGWGRPIPLTIRFASGKELTYRVAAYAPGAVILGKEEAYSKDLPAVLSGLGIELPSQREHSE